MGCGARLHYNAQGEGIEYRVGSTDERQQRLTMHSKIYSKGTDNEQQSKMRFKICINMTAFFVFDYRINTADQTQRPEGFEEDI